MPSLSISSVIGDFDRFLSGISSKFVQSPEYAAAKYSWFDLLEFLKPVVTDRYFPDRETKVAAELHQMQLTGVHAEGLVERTLYFGLLSFCVLCSNQARHLYTRVDRQELTEKWFSAALYPVEALEYYRFFELAGRKTVETFATRFFISEIEPLIKDSSRHEGAFRYFVSQYYSGMVLGQIMDGLIVREYYRTKDAR